MHYCTKQTCLLTWCCFDCFLMTLILWMFAVMHDLCMIHTDLKPENVLLVSSEYIKVPDYKVLLWFSLLIFASILFHVPSFWHCSFSKCTWICRVLRTHQKILPTLKECQSQVLLRWLILAAQLMSAQIRTTLYPPDIIVRRRLSLVNMFSTYFLLYHRIVIDLLTDYDLYF